MSRRFWQFIYNAFSVPIQFLGFHLIGLFSAKVRRGIRGRRTSKVALKEFCASRDKNNPVYVVHCASLGEYEMAKPIIEGIREQHSKSDIVLTFFSPSGYEQVKDDNSADLTIYLPFDSVQSVNWFYKKLQPQKLILTSYEIWPNLIWLAKHHNITSYVTSARLRSGSAKTWPIIRNFYSTVFRDIDHIYPITETDMALIQKYFDLSEHTEIDVLGNTRYDRVLERSQHHKDTHLLPQGFQHQPTVIAGSIWPNDNRVILPALMQILQDYEQLKLVLAPHEPNTHHLSELEQWCIDNQLSYRLLSETNGDHNRSRIILVDSVGVLAELYRDGDIAFVGGAFKGAVHNVMEPAAADCVVTFGPKYHNSNEAELLVKNGGGFTVENADQFQGILQNLLSDQEKLKRSQQIARQIIQENAGATQKTVSHILREPIPETISPL